MRDAELHPELVELEAPYPDAPPTTKPRSQYVRPLAISALTLLLLGGVALFVAQRRPAAPVTPVVATTAPSSGSAPVTTPTATPSTPAGTPETPTTTPVGIPKTPRPAIEATRSTAVRDPFVPKGQASTTVSPRATSTGDAASAVTTADVGVTVQSRQSIASTSDAAPAPVIELQSSTSARSQARPTTQAPTPVTARETSPTVTAQPPTAATPPLILTPPPVASVQAPAPIVMSSSPVQPSAASVTPTITVVPATASSPIITTSVPTTSSPVIPKPVPALNAAAQWVADHRLTYGGSATTDTTTTAILNTPTGPLYVDVGQTIPDTQVKVVSADEKSLVLHVQNTTTRLRLP